MASDYDATEFVDGDFQTHKSSRGTPPAGGTPSQRAPTHEDIVADLAQTQQKLAAILREKEEKERERAALEETRRRQMEFLTGREEMVQNLTRGVGLLEEAEFSARRDVEQMAKALADLRDALIKVQAVHEESWTKENFSLELTRALTVLENARMEWNTARLKFAVLSAPLPEAGAAAAQPQAAPQPWLSNSSFLELCRLGLAFTWPLVVVALFTSLALIFILLRH